MMSEKLLKGFNEQIKHEFDAANIYLAMAAYCKAEDLDGFANFFIVQGEEKPCRKAKMSMLLNRDTRSPMSSSREVTLCAGQTTQSTTGNS